MIVVDGAGNIYYWTNGGGSTSVYEAPAGSSTGTVVATLPSTSGGIDVGGYADPSGNLYVGHNNGAIYKIAAGTHGQSLYEPIGTFSRVLGIASDSAGNFFVGDLGNSEVYKIPAGGGTPTPIFALGLAAGIAVDPAGDVFVANYGNTTIVKLAAGTYAQTGTLSGATSTSILDFDGFGNLYISSPAAIQTYTRTTGRGLSFVNQAVNTISPAQYVSVENDGNATMTFGTLTTTPVAPPFSDTATGGTCVSAGTLNAGALCNVAVTYSPTSATGTTSTGTANVVDNSLNAAGSTQTFPLYGTTGPAPGTTPQSITFTPPPTPVVVGSSYTLSATASSNLAVVFTVVSGNATIVGNVITYNGSGTVVIAANQSGNATYAAAPTVTQSVTVTGPVVVNNVAQLVANVGATVNTAAITVTFSSSTTLGPVTPVTTGDTGLDFSIVSGAGTTCTPGATVATSCTVTVQFKPIAPGVRLGAVNIYNNASPAALVGVVYLNGLGNSPLGVYSTGTQTTIANSNVNGTIAVDAAGTVYAFANGDLKKFANGTGAGVTVVSGAAYSYNAVGIDAVGNLYYWFMSGTTVYELPVGATTPIAITGFTAPSPLAAGVDFAFAADGSGNVYFGGYAGGIVQVAPGTHALTTLVGAGAVPSGTSPTGGGTFVRNTGMALDAAGNLYIADYLNHALYKLAAGASTLTTIARNDGILDFGPVGLAIDPAGSLYVGIYDSHKLYKYAYNGSTYTPTLLTPAGGDLGNQSVVIDGNGNLYTSSTANSQYKITRTSGATVTLPTTQIGTTSTPATSVPFENDGNVALAIGTFTPTTQTPGTTPQVFGYAAGSCGASLAVGASCNASANITPVANSLYGGTGTILDDNLYNNANTTATSQSQTVPLTGQGSTNAAPTLTFNPGTPVIVGSSATLTATSSQPTAGTITFSEVNGTGTATLTGSAITYNTTGTVVVTATQPGNSTYASATSSVTVTIVNSVATTGTSTINPTNVGASQTGITATFTFTNNTTLGATPYSAVTTGTTVTDYAATGGTCVASSSWTSGQSCTVLFTFAPTAPGLRNGAINLLNSAGGTVASDFVSGVGLSPLGDFTSGTLAGTYGGYFPIGVAVDAADNFYQSNANGIVVKGVHASGGGYSSYNNLVTNTTCGIYGGLGVDGAGNVYATGYGCTTLYEAAGAGINAPSLLPIATLPSTAYFGLAVDGAGNAYVGAINGSVTKVAAVTHALTTVVAAGLIPGAIAGLAFDSNGNLYATTQATTVYKITLPGGGVSTLFTDATNLNGAFGIAVDAAGDLYVSNRTISTIIRYQNTGTYTAPTYSTASAAKIAGIGNANGSLAIDSTGNLIYSTDNSAGTYVYTRTTGATVTFPITTKLTAATAIPVAFENDGNVSMNITSAAGTTVSPATTPNVFAGSGLGTCGTTLAVSASCNASAGFTPSSNVAYTGTDTILDDSLFNTNNTTTPAISQTTPLAGTGSSSTQMLMFTAGDPPATAAVGSTATLLATTTATPAASYPITYAITTGATLATITGTTITFNAPGTVVVTASQAGDTNYSSATTTATITVSAGVISTSSITSPVATLTGGSVTVTFATATVLSSTTPVKVLTDGLSGLDFAYVSAGSTCTGTVTTCTVNYSFTPAYPGLRRGAINVYNASNEVVATVYLTGTGTSGLGVFSTGVPTTITTTTTNSYQNVVDAAGSLYAVTNGNLVKYTNGVAGAALVTGLGYTDIALDGAGDVYLWGVNAQLYELPAGATTPAAVSSLIPITTPALGQGGVVGGNGNLYIGGASGGIYQVAPGTHKVTTFISAGAVPTGGGTFQSAAGFARDAAGNLYVTDPNNNSVYKVAAGTPTLTTVARNDGFLNNPFGIAVDAAGNLYIANDINGGNTSAPVIKYTLSGTTYTPSKLPITASTGVAIDGLGNLYLTTSSSVSLVMYTRTAPPTTVFPSAAPGSTSAAQQIGFENDGNIGLVISAVGATSTNPAAATTFTQAGSTAPTCVAGTLGVGANCNLGEEFTPVAAAPANTSFAGFGTIADQNLNVTTTQQAPLLGSDGTGLQNITFYPTTPLVYTPGLQVTLNATSSAGLTPIVYTITSSTPANIATISGSVLTFTGPGSVTIAANQAGNATYAAAATASATIVAQATSLLSWTPTKTTIAPGVQLGGGILDAFGQYVSSLGPVYTTIPGNVTYTATNQATSVVTSGITSTSTLAAGTYTLTATFVPTDTTTFSSPATGNITLIVRAGTIFVANSNGTVSEFSSTGVAGVINVAGGGIGLGINSLGTVYSITSTGSLSSFTDANVASTTYGYLNAAGASATSGPTSLAVDGSSVTWIAQSETEPSSGGSVPTAGDIAKFNGTTVTARIAGDASIGTPSAIVVDASGSLWVSSSNNTVVEVIGAAKPVETPTVQSLIDGTLATQP
jgi:hypothetical protein